MKLTPEQQALVSAAHGGDHTALMALADHVEENGHDPHLPHLIRAGVLHGAVENGHDTGGQAWGRWDRHDGESRGQHYYHLVLPAHSYTPAVHLAVPTHHPEIREIAEQHSGVKAPAGDHWLGENPLWLSDVAHLRSQSAGDQVGSAAHTLAHGPGGVFTVASWPEHPHTHGIQEYTPRGQFIRHVGSRSTREAAVEHADSLANPERARLARRKPAKVEVPEDELKAWQEGLHANPHSAPVFADWLEERGAAHPRTLDFLRSNPGGRLSVLRHPDTGHVVAVHTPAVGSWDEMAAHSMASGHAFFRPDTRRFFRSRKGHVVVGPGGVFFTESTQGMSLPRTHKVHRYDPTTAEISGGDEDYPSAKHALRAATRAAFAPETPEKLAALKSPEGGGIVNNLFARGGQFMAKPRRRVAEVCAALRGEKPTKLAKPKAADVRTSVEGLAHVGPILADKLEENGWHHDDATLDLLRSGEPYHVARHPKSGKAVAWRNTSGFPRIQDVPSLLNRIRLNLPPLQHIDGSGFRHAVHGPGGLYSVHVEPGYFGQGEMTTVTSHHPDTGLHIAPVSQRTRAHPEAVREALATAKRLAFPG